MAGTPSDSDSASVIALASDEGYIEIMLIGIGDNYNNGYNEVRILIYGTEVENPYTIYPWEIGEKIIIGKSSSDYIVNGAPLNPGDYLVKVIILDTLVLDGTVQNR